MKMKLLIVFISFVIFVNGDDSCYDAIVEGCRVTNSSFFSCEATYGKSQALGYNLRSFANEHITYNYHYLLLSSHFNSFKSNRQGFSKLFRKLSDKSWDDAINTIKYMAKRGIPMSFESKLSATLTHPTDEINSELQSLSKALDMQKSLAVTANKLHHIANGVDSEDGEIMSYIENNFVHQLRDSVRDLSGHTNDLKNLVSTSNVPLNLFLFDEYLKQLY